MAGVRGVRRCPGGFQLCARARLFFFSLARVRIISEALDTGGHRGHQPFFRGKPWTRRGHRRTRRPLPRTRRTPARASRRALCYAAADTVDLAELLEGLVPALPGALGAKPADPAAPLLPRRRPRRRAATGARRPRRRPATFFGSFLPRRRIRASRVREISSHVFRNKVYAD
jgi:hypothetical protein